MYDGVLVVDLRLVISVNRQEEHAVIDVVGW
jgi:hypothetical protein